MSWVNKIPRCFGCDDGIFAGHPNDEQSARELLKELKEGGISLEDLVKEVEIYLTKRDTHDSIREKHIAEQVESVKSMAKKLGLT